MYINFSDEIISDGTAELIILSSLAFETLRKDKKDKNNTNLSKEKTKQNLLGEVKMSFIIFQFQHNLTLHIVRPNASCGAPRQKCVMVVFRVFKFRLKLN